jgi:hypothetical protein
MNLGVKMLLKDLIKQLQDKYYSYDKEYFEVMGEPEIMIDVFDKVDDLGGERQYSGFSPNIEITSSGDGVYLIIAAKETWK